MFHKFLWSILLLSQCFFTAAFCQNLIILEGTLVKGSTIELKFVADENSLQDVIFTNACEGECAEREISGQQIMGSLGDQLREQAHFYRRAQIARGVKSSELEPLYVILDPKGSWAFAHPVARFSYRRNGKKYKVNTSAIVMGKDPTYAKKSTSYSEEDGALNSEILESLSTWYDNHTKSFKLKKLLTFYSLTFSTGEKLNLIESAKKLGSRRYFKWLKDITTKELTEEGLDGNKLWQENPSLAELEDKLTSLDAQKAGRQIGETFSHELGHLIHFSSVGWRDFDLGGYKPHMRGNSHTMQTLSNEEFAFTEGFAEANSMVVVGTPTYETNEPLTINYGSTAKDVRKKLNHAFAHFLSKELHARGLLPKDKALSVLPFDTERDEFTKNLRQQATNAGMTEEDIDSVIAKASAQAEVAHLLKVEKYVASLEARKGEKRSRYDFLRSEMSVAHTLASLRRKLGISVMDEVLKTMATKGSNGEKPSTMAELIEAFAARNPAHRLQVYRTIAEATDGILITNEQIEFLEKHPTLEVDIDQNGSVPGGKGANAMLLHPNVFPKDAAPMPGIADPLEFSGDKTPAIFGEFAAVGATTTRSEGEPPLAVEIDEAKLTKEMTGRDQSNPEYFDLNVAN